MVFGKIFDAGKDAVAEKALNVIGRMVVEKHLDGIIVLDEVRVENRRPVLHFRLEGVPEKLLTAHVGYIDISEDGKTVSLGKFSSNTAFVENALNRFATLSIDVPDEVAMGLKLARKLFL